MKKTIIIYKSKTGFTKRYAEMISKALNSTMMDYKDITEKTMSEYDVVVFGTRLHAGIIDGYKKAKKVFEKSSAREFVLFVTGGTPNKAEDIINKVWKDNLSADELVEVPHFYMQSGLNYEKMSFLNKLLMKMATGMMKNKKNKDSNDIGFEQAITKSYDISSREYIEPLVNYIKKSVYNE